MCGIRRKRVRRLTTVLVLILYLFAGALHAISDFDVAISARGAVVSVLNDDAHGTETENGIVGAHHCHGCFSVSVPIQISGSAALELVRSVIAFRGEGLSDSLIGVEPPPPKFLT